MTVRGSDERGMIGKLLAVWLLLLVLLGVAVFDAASILMTNVRLSDAARRAATNAAATLNRGQRPVQACAVAAETLDEQQPDARRPSRSWCEVDGREGRVTIRLHQDAGSLLAHRLSFTEGYAAVAVEESAGRSAL